MADTKISALASGSPAVGTDEYVIARAGANYKLTLAMMLAAGDSPVAATSLTATGLCTLAGEDTITAFAGGGKASATALSATKNLHRISVCATAGDSFLLPPALAGQAHYVRHDGAAAAQAFGAGTDTINGVATATGIVHPAGLGMWYVCTTAGAWTTSLSSYNPVFTGTVTPSPTASVDLGTTSAYFKIGYIGKWLHTGFLAAGASGGYGLWSNATPEAGNNVGLIGVASTQPYVSFSSGGSMGFSNSTTNVNTIDSAWARAGAANSIVWSSAAAPAAGNATSRVEINKAVTTFTNNVAKAVLTFTVPNAAHSASFLVRIVGSMGAGGAVGANESTQSATYIVDITRTAGVNAVATIGATYGQPAAASVAGAANIATTAALSAISGAVGAANTFTVDVTLARSAGTADNHTALVHCSLLNANATGVTVA